ncbi:MAG: hypothetical protein ABIF40_00335 [archaeon]
MIPWILISIAVLILLLLAVAIFLSKKNKREPDYYSFFILGIIWTVIGIPLDNFALSAIGIIFLIIGLANKNKWKKNKRTWKKLNKKEKRVRIIITVILGILVLLGLVLYLIQIL